MDKTESIEQVYRSFYGGLFIFANSKLRNRELAEEAVQETFRIACSKPNEFRAATNKNGWLVEVLKQVMMDIQKHRAKDIELMAAIANTPSEALRTYDPAKVEMLYGNYMNDLDFRILVRFSVYGDSIAVISKNTGLSISAVKKRLERARKKYREKLK